MTSLKLCIIAAILLVLSCMEITQETTDATFLNLTSQISKLKQNPQRFTKTLLNISKGQDNFEDISHAFIEHDSCTENGTTSCTSWSSCVKGTCKCLHDTIGGVMDCDTKGQLIGILPCYCVTYNETSDIAEFGLCELNCMLHWGRYVDGVYNSLPINKSEWNQVTCGYYNRSGTLCGKCQDGLYLQAYSYNIWCIECEGYKSNWWNYILIAYLPLTALYFVVLLLKINIPCSRLQGFVLFSQIVFSPQIARIYLIYTHRNHNSVWISSLLASCFGIWNLDFFRWYNFKTCLKIGTLPALALNLAIAVYPLFLMTVTYVLINTAYKIKLPPFSLLWKLFKKLNELVGNNWKIKTSTVDAFATFMYLSHAKFLTACSDLLVPVRVYQFSSFNTTSELRLYYDATISYFGREHLPYAILAIIFLTVFVLLPTLTLLFYPSSLYQKGLQKLPARCQIFIHTFTDSFQGCYKNGTDAGTTDCRWFSAIPFLLRIAVTLSYSLTLQSTFLLIASGLVIIIAIITVNADPYKPHYKNPFIFYIIFLACTFTSCNGINLAFVADQNETADHVFYYGFLLLFLSMPLLILFASTLEWVITRRKFRITFSSYLKTWKKNCGL